jgi:transposase
MAWRRWPDCCEGGDVDEIRAMHQQGLSITDIAELTGFDRKTVRKWLLQPGPRGMAPASVG